MINGRERERLNIIKDKTLTYDQKVKKVKDNNLCDEPDVFSMYEEDIKGCPLCNYKGYFIDERPDTDVQGKVIKEDDGTIRMREVWVDCECKHIREHKKMVERANIPFRNKYIRLKDVLPDIYKDSMYCKSAISELKALLDDMNNVIAEGYGVGIYSKTKGSGKSYIMSAFANELLDKDYEVVFVNQVEMIDKIKASWERDNNTESEDKILNKYRTAQILIIDDIGFNENKSWLNDKMYSIINYRYENKKPIFYTSNCSVSEMNFDERIVSRLKEMTNEIQYPEQDVRELDAITGKRSLKYTNYKEVNELFENVLKEDGKTGKNKQQKN